MARWAQPWCSEMAQRITAEETRAWFAERMNEWPDYGFGTAVLGLMLHPRNPFNVNERRKFKAGFLFAVAWLGAAVALFVFFNFTLGRP